MSRKQTLSDNASIYQKRENTTERDKWSQMSKQEKWQYFKDYYLLKLIVLVFAVIFTGYVLYTTFGPRDTPELYGVIFNDQLNSEQRDTVLNNFREAMTIPEKRHTFTLDDTFNLDPNDPDVTTEQKITTYAYAGKLDIIIAEEETIKYLAEGQYLQDLTQILPSDFYSSNTDQLIFARQQEDTSDVAYGISLENSAIYKEMSINYNYNGGKKMAVGVVVNSDHRDNAVQFIKYLLSGKV
ncbi:MAG: hypothetical protein Q4F05_08635 [bacterium]|nr:hypothetical protein [bacterium]